MILYLDAGAIVKQYVSEFGSVEIETAATQAEANGTAVISRAEVIAALAKATRTGVLSETNARTAVRSFNRNWPDLVRTRITERLVKHAAALAFTHGLRGYDAIHVASAAAWQQALGNAVTVATFDQTMWSVAGEIGLEVFPSDLPALLSTRQRSR